MIRKIRHIRSRKITAGAARLQDGYDSKMDSTSVATWQLERFNALWSEWRKYVPYYSALVEEFRLPVKFRSWEEFRDIFPVMNRGHVQAAGERLHDQRFPADYWRKTGGSTAEPLQIPAWNSERELSAFTMWYARSWFGVAPPDSLFLLWGHSHLLGPGIFGKFNGLKRALQDYILGYTRWSAYDLTEAALRRAGDCLLERRSDWLLGYSVALDRFARVNRDRADQIRALNLKLAVGTAESFPFSDSARLVEEVLGCPVAMEYGAVETGVLAHQHQDGSGFRVMWQDHMIEREKDTSEILVTSLFSRACPLLRYRLGDRIEPIKDISVNIRFKRVSGRCNESITLSSGRLIHSEAFAHVVKESSEIRGFQIIQNGGGSLVFRYLALEPINPPLESELRRRLEKIDPELRDLEIVHTTKLEQTISGKTPMVLSMPDNF